MQSVKSWVYSKNEAEGGKEDDISESFVQFSTLVLIIHEIIIGFWRWDLWVTLYCTFRHYAIQDRLHLLRESYHKILLVLLLGSRGPSTVTLMHLV